MEFGRLLRRHPVVLPCVVVLGALAAAVVVGLFSVPAEAASMPSAEGAHTAPAAAAKRDPAARLRRMHLVAPFFAFSPRI